MQYLIEKIMTGKVIKYENKRWCLFMCILLCLHTLSYGQEASNDHIFASSAAARPFIDFDSKGFIIKGKRTFLVSAGIEYARVPHELWHDRLLRLQRAGFNCVEMYTFWNFHEPQEGRFSFSGDWDLDLFLKEIKALGMYAIVRVGPYYCAEWENGGYPTWLRFKPGVRVREDNIEFEKYVDKFFDKLLPIVFANQVNHGGCVVMVQLENEHTKGWGTAMPDGYFHHLQSKALALGLEVPYFFSGLHHSSDPAGNALSLDDSSRPNPWFSTEFWSIWYSAYGSNIQDAKRYERRTWKIIARGGNGYNYYMAHGGTNFGYTNNNEDAASYDYGAAVGQAGDLRPIYCSFKKMAWFARSFQNVLENSTDATRPYEGFVADTGIITTARHSNIGDIIFLDNPSPVQRQIKMPGGIGSFPQSGNMITLKPGEIFPVIHNYKINEAINIEWSNSRIFGIADQENVSSIVIYGDPGSSADFVFSTSSQVNITEGKTGLSVSSNKVHLQAKFVENTPVEYGFSCGGKKIRIIAVSTELADHTWFIENKKELFIIIGPAYIGDINQNNGHYSLTTEESWKAEKQYPVWVYNAGAVIKLNKRNVVPVIHQKIISLAAWQRKDASSFAARGYDDGSWLKSKDPAPMATDGKPEPEAWYRTKVDIDTNGVYTLQLEGADRVTTFVDGKLTGTGSLANEEIAYEFSKGKHSLAFFTAHDGFDKFAGYTGPIDSVDRKGLFGPAFLKKDSSSIQSLNTWRFLKAMSVDDVNKEIPSASLSTWGNYTIGEDAFSKHEGFGWFQTALPKPPPGTLNIEIKFKSADENATVFINNRKVMKHDGWNRPFIVTINHADTITTPLQLTVFIENYSNEGGIDGTVRANYMGALMPVQGWRLFGGTGDSEKMGEWKDTDSIAQKGKPAFYKTSFTLKESISAGNYPVWRVVPEGLGHGSVWVNGHNLGRYPEKIPVMGLYIPECWLKKGANTLLIYDEDGADPKRVSIQSEEAAGRTIQAFGF